MKIRFYNSIVIPLLLLFLYCTKNGVAQVTASFTTNITSGCAPLNVSFTNTSSGATTYSWDFGNGNNSTVTNPGAIFSTPGTFTVTLTAINGGSSDAATQIIQVFNNPVADFTMSTMPSCPGSPITFTDNSTIGNGALASWSWDFGNGSGQSTTTTSITHTYTNSGSFPVSMIVTDANGCSNSIIKNVTISPTPVASFTGNPISACSPPLNVNFTSTSTITGTVTYAWSFGDGNTSTQQNPSNTYTANGGYNVQLKITQGACSDSTTINNYIGIQNITADFSASVTTVCAGVPLNFTNSSFPLTVNHSWDFGDGGTSTDANPTHTYTTAGTYAVTLIEGTGSCTDTETKTAYITVNPSPDADFSATPNQRCSPPLGSTFSNTSTPGCIYTWNFGDGSSPFTTGSTSNFLYNYTTPGAYTVTLSVAASNGCITEETKTDYIVISDLSTDFEASPFQGCIPLDVTFTSTSTSSGDPIINYKWNFGNGTATTATGTANNTYNAVGLYTVSLVVETAGGCRDSITKTSYIRAGVKPTANFSVVDPTVCYGTDAEFTDLSVGADSAYWQFDDAQGTFSTPSGATLPYNPVTNLFPDTGTFYVMQIAFSNGCADTLTLDDAIRILPPKPIIEYDLSCDDLYTVTFHDASLGADSIVWDFGDGSPTVSNDTAPVHTYATRGSRLVTLTAYNFETGCHSSAVELFTIAEPIAQFTPSPVTGCYPLVVTFTSTSQDESTTLWNYGDGSPNDPSASPALHVFAQPGLDTVTLIITDVNGCSDTATQTVSIYGAIPDNIASVTAGCAPLAVTLTDASISDSLLVQWLWDFGDGSPTQTVSTPSVNHVYANPGFYTVTMTVTDVTGCSKTVTKPNFIQPTFPTPSFVVDTFACRNEILFFDASATTVIPPATYNWDFGDGTTATGVIATHAYTASNNYTVTLTVTDVNGCDSSIQHQVLIQHPASAFSDSVLLIGCGVTNMQFTENSTGTAITGWQWYFGDGASATQQNPMHAYTVPATYTVSLVTTNAAGCTDSISNSVVVPGPTGTFSFTPTIGCPPLNVTFTAVSNNAVSYTWDFGDGTVITTATPTTQYAYNTDIIATPALLLNFVLSNGSNCQLPAPTAGQVTVVTVIPTVAINASTTSGCYPVTVNFTDLSSLPGTIPNDSINSWVWNFGDGTTSNDQHPTHTYNQPGSYNVSLSVGSKGGCTNANTATPTVITVHPYPIAAFSLNASEFDLPYDAMTTTNQSAGAVTYLWSFGDGSTSTEFSPTYTYTTVGNFPVQLIATSQFGCPDTAITQITTNTDVVYPNAFTPNPHSSNGGAYDYYTLNNDVFFPYTAGVEEYKFTIYNRWGEVLFETEDVKVGWDGYYRGKICEQGVYIWKAYVKLNNGKIYNKNGDVTLLR